MKKKVLDSSYCLNADQVASYLGISRSLAYQLMHEKDFPCISVRGRLVVPQDRFLQWMDKQLELNQKEKRGNSYDQKR